MSDKQSNNPTVSEVFESLIHNAIDFFKHSILEFEKDPKYSVIHFYTSVELFFKARLLTEHWALVLSDPKTANFKKFRQGDFGSVGLDETMQRLSGIAGENFDKQARDIFTKLRNHRNRLMHFYHGDYLSKDSQLLTEIAAEQCRGWYYLHRLLTIDWESQFKPYFEEINDLATLMKKQKEFLRVRFEFLHKKIEQEKAEGVTYVECPSCGFFASRVDLKDSILADAKCLVCEDEFSCLNITCPHCKQNAVIDSSTMCSHCKNPLPFWEIMEVLPKQLNEWAYCDNCRVDAMATIVKIDDEWLCLSCFTKYKNWEVSRCQWCGETVTGDTGTYYDPGCFMCAVHLMREAEEDDQRNSSGNDS